MANKVGAVLVLGGGIGGMQAALDLADTDYKVYVLEKSPAIGGVMVKLDKTFPTNDCSMCTIAPRLVGVGRHPNITILSYSEFLSLEGEAGEFDILFRKKSRYIDEIKCNGCGLCAEHCPAEAIDAYNLGLGIRKTIYLNYPQAIPRVYTIDREKCIGCGLCANICGAGAVNYTLKDEEYRIKVGAVIVAPGFELFDPKNKPEYGYGPYKNVITSLEFERILSPSGPYLGSVLRPYDGKVPARIAFLQCVGSRDFERDYCSSVCCMYATKEAIIAKEHTAEELECDIFFMDLRAFSKGFEEYYERAKELGVNYIRCRIPSIKELPETKNLIIEYLTEDDKKVSSEYDLVVLSAGIQPPKGVKYISENLGIKLNEFGFCESPVFRPVESQRAGIYIGGVFTGPKDIPETVMQATAAASKAMVFLSDVRGSLITPKVYPPEIDVTGQEPRIGVFVCHCGTNIASVVNVLDVVGYVRNLPDVVFATNTLYACSVDSCENIKEMIKEHNLNRVVVASCTPRTHEPLFQSVVREAGLNEYLFEMANIRDQCSWVHMHEPEGATKKAKDLVRMAVAKARLIEPLYRSKVKINRGALVIGGGVAGMIAALDLANQGFKAYLVEKEKELGGNLRRVCYLLNGENVQQNLSSIIDEVEDNRNIEIYTDAQITEIEGTVGRFKTHLNTNGKEQELEHGIVIVATGAEEYKPTEYKYGQDERIMTQLELETAITENRISFPPYPKAKTVVMIQCVGSRDRDRPYCSRICCAEAIKNALKIKEISPDTNVYIIYRDIRTYGFIEGYYTKAREKGVVFIRYEDYKKPEVTKENDELNVSVVNATLNEKILITSDILVLSAATVPREDSENLAKKLKIPLTRDKFFLEAHMKLRPVDFATDGVFLCGLAHAPKTLDESISQASAAASRASTIISKDEIELEAAISTVIDANCDGCAYCIDPCPYKALTLLEYMKKGEVKKTVYSDPSKCKGCGVCQATCPKKGIEIRHFKLDQLMAMVEACLMPD